MRNSFSGAVLREIDRLYQKGERYTLSSDLSQWIYSQESAGDGLMQLKDGQRISLWASSSRLLSALSSSRFVLWNTAPSPKRLIFYDRDKDCFLSLDSFPDIAADWTCQLSVRENTLFVAYRDAGKILRVLYTVRIPG